MHRSILNTAIQIQINQQKRNSNMQRNMALNFEETEEASEPTMGEEESKPVVQEVSFRCDEHQEAFTRLTTRQQEYIVAYMETGSPTEVAKALGLCGSAIGVGKRIREITKLMGLDSTRELRESNQEKKASSVELRKLIAEQDYRCALSGVEMTPDDAELDHIDPIENGGSNEINNLQWLHKDVNRAKGTMSQDEFLLICKRVNAWRS